MNSSPQQVTFSVRVHAGVGSISLCKKIFVNNCFTTQQSIYHNYDE